MRAPHSVFLVDFTLDQSKTRLAPRANHPINQSSKQTQQPEQQPKKETKSNDFIYMELMVCVFSLSHSIMFMGQRRRVKSGTHVESRLLAWSPSPRVHVSTLASNDRFSMHVVLHPPHSLFTLHWSFPPLVVHTQAGSTSCGAHDFLASSRPACLARLVISSPLLHSPPRANTTHSPSASPLQ